MWTLTDRIGCAFNAHHEVHVNMSLDSYIMLKFILPTKCHKFYGMAAFLHFHVLLWCPWDFWGSFSVGTEIWGEFHHIYRLIQLELILVEKKIDYLASFYLFKPSSAESSVSAQPPLIPAMCSQLLNIITHILWITLFDHEYYYMWRHVFR